MAGPWFAVHRIGGDWKTLDHLWLSDGKATSRARIEARISFEESNHETQ